LGLLGAIKNLKLNDSIMQLEIIAPEPLPKLPAALEVALYRIASEALHNVVRHAHATRCVVCLEVSNQMITLTITDNGESSPQHYVAGIGLHSMRERAAELGGSLIIQPAAPSGTQIIAQLPVSF
jgi:two-component system, NarL family, sensor kinase